MISGVTYIWNVINVFLFNDFRRIRQPEMSLSELVPGPQPVADAWRTLELQSAQEHDAAHHQHRGPRYRVVVGRPIFLERRINELRCRLAAGAEGRLPIGLGSGRWNGARRGSPLPRMVRVCHVSWHSIIIISLFSLFWRKPPPSCIDGIEPEKRSGRCLSAGKTQTDSLYTNKKTAAEWITFCTADEKQRGIAPNPSSSVSSFPSVIRRDFALRESGGKRKIDGSTGRMDPLVPALPPSMSSTWMFPLTGHFL